VGREAERILRTCVHCGFCLATCPTYRLLGDELDSPRGRIYLIKSLLEGNTVSTKTLLHLDRCLTCRACETTCPSGVEYGQLLEIGRDQAERTLPRPLWSRLQRWILRQVLPYRCRFTPLLRTGQLLRPLLPARLRRRIPVYVAAEARPANRHARRVILFEGCVQPALSPDINAAAARLLDRLGIGSIAVLEEGCCGALDLHLGAGDVALTRARHNIDNWWPLLDDKVEAILITASGCGVTVKDYGRLLQDDPRYADKAARISQLAMDPAEYFSMQENLPHITSGSNRIAFQSPCTLQHGQKLAGVTESLLTRMGFTLTEVPDSDQCCGSAGPIHYCSRHCHSNCVGKNCIPCKGTQWRG
jgi:glycolate oxidase iron-sulfur subunit